MVLFLQGGKKLKLARTYGWPQPFQEDGVFFFPLSQGCGFIIGLISRKTGLLPQIMFLLPS